MKPIFFIIIISVSLFSCSLNRKISNFQVNKTPVKEALTPLKQSYSTIPISIPLKYFYNELTTQLKQYVIVNEDYSPEDKQGYTNVEDGVQIKYALRIDETNFSNPGHNTFVLGLKINYVLWGRTTKGPGGFWKYVDCANDGDKWLGLVFEVKIPYPITSDAIGAAKVIAVNFFDTECNLGFKFWSQPGHEKLANGIICAVEKAINTQLRRVVITSIVESNLKKIKPDNYFSLGNGLPRANAKVKINNASIGKIEFNSESLNFTVGLNYNTIICTDDINPFIPLESSSANSILETSDQTVGFHNNIGIALSYKTIDNVITNFVSKKITNSTIKVNKWPFRFVNFRIEDIKTEADEYGHLIINAKTKGFPNSNIVIKCYPVINSLSNTLILKDFSYAINSKNILVPILKPFFKKSIRKFIQNNSIINYNTTIVSLNNSAIKRLNNLNVKFFQPHLNTNYIGIIDVKPMKDYIVLYVENFGDAKLDIKSSDIKIKLPSSPFRAKRGDCK